MSMKDALGLDPEQYDFSPLGGGITLFCRTCISELQSITGAVCDLGQEPTLSEIISNCLIHEMSHHL